jgi:foldase protein PrsA
MRHIAIFTALLLSLGVLAGCKDTGVATSPEATAPAAAALQATTAGGGQPATADAGQEAAAPEVAGDLVATVNGEGIPLALFQRQVFAAQHYYVEQGLDPNTEEGQRQLLSIRRQQLDDMIDEVLIEQAAAQLGVTVTAQELDQRMALYVEQFGSEAAFEDSLSQTGSTRDEIRDMERSAAIGDKMMEHITSGDTSQTAEAAHVRHILCATAADCDKAAARLAAGEDFATVAEDVSVDTSTSQRGGDLDWIVRGLTPSQTFEDAIFSLPVGQISQPVTTEFGTHIIEVLERDRERPLSEQQQSDLRSKQLMDWLAKRRAESKIEIYVDDLADVAQS